MGSVMGELGVALTEMSSCGVGGGVGAAVEAAVGELCAGRPVVVVDGVGAGDAVVVFAAEHASAELVAFAVRHGSGFMCVAMGRADCERLGLDPMPRDRGAHPARAQRTTVDAVATGTGISARDRAVTISALASGGSSPGDFRRPGHVVPVCAEEGGVLSRRGAPEAVLYLVRLAGLRPVGAFCALVSAERPHGIADAVEARRFASVHGLAVVSVEDLFTHRVRVEGGVRRCADRLLPIRHGPVRVVGYRAAGGGVEHLALVFGLDEEPGPVPVHVHPECLVGDVLGSLGCDCGRMLGEAVTEMAALGRGVIIYVRSADGVGAFRLFGSAWADRGDVAATAAWILDDLGVSQEHVLGGLEGSSLCHVDSAE